MIRTNISITNPMEVILFYYDTVRNVVWYQVGETTSNENQVGSLDEYFDFIFSHPAIANIYSLIQWTGITNQLDGFITERQEDRFDIVGLNIIGHRRA